MPTSRRSGDKTPKEKSGDQTERSGAHEAAPVQLSAEEAARRVGLYMEMWEWDECARLGPPGTSRLLEALENRSYGIQTRCKIAGALARVGVAEGVRYLENALRSFENPMFDVADSTRELTWVAVAAQLASAGNQAGLDELIKVIQEAKAAPETRCAAAQTLEAAGWHPKTIAEQRALRVSRAGGRFSLHPLTDELIRIVAEAKSEDGRERRIALLLKGRLESWKSCSCGFPAVAEFLDVCESDSQGEDGDWFVGEHEIAHCCPFCGTKLLMKTEVSRLR